MNRQKMKYIKNPIVKDYYNRHKIFHKALNQLSDYAELARIKEVSKRIKFASINETQIDDNVGNIYYELDGFDSWGEDIKNIVLEYIIVPNEVGTSSGIIKNKTNENGEDVSIYESSESSHYRRFIIDILTQRILYSEEMETFIRVEGISYKIIDETTFQIEYPINKKEYIPNFYDSMIEIFRDHIDLKHNYNIHPYTIVGKDWYYNCKNSDMNEFKHTGNDLFVIHYDVPYDALNFEKPNKFLNYVADGAGSLHNVKLLHAYAMLGRLGLQHREKFVAAKDFGRTGKGLFSKTFEPLHTVKKVSMDALLGGSFDQSNEWVNFKGANVAMANEVGDITPSKMRILRKIATGETVSGRSIGRDAIEIKLDSFLWLDTNESFDTGEMKANVTRTIKVSFKDRPKDETEQERMVAFKEHWDFIAPDGKTPSLEASVSMLLCSLLYFESVGSKFDFDGDIQLREYYSADDLSDTQELVLRHLATSDFLFSSDPILKDLIIEDYNKANTKTCSEAFRKIGVGKPHSKKIDGQVCKVRTIENEKKFNMAYKLLIENEF